MAEEILTEEQLGVDDTTLTVPTIDISDTEESAQAPPPPKPEIPQPYTDDEASQILESGGELDAKRLTPAQKLIQKSFEKYSTRTWQEAAEARKQYEAKTAELSKPKTIYEAFDVDPVGVKRSLNEAILQKEAEDPYGEDAIKLKRVKGELEIYETEKRTQSQMFNTLVNENQTIIKNAIPDFNDKKSQALTDFAINELGLTNDEVEYLTSHRHGKLAAKITIVANKLYEKFNAGKSAEEKAVKPQAITLGRAGASTGSSESKSFTKFELAKMMINEPEKYQALQPEILKAYSEGMVK